MDRNDGQHGAVRNEVQARQGGRTQLTIWVLVASLILATVVGFFLFTARDQVSPNRPAAVQSPANPGAPPAEPKTNP